MCVYVCEQEPCISASTIRVSMHLMVALAQREKRVSSALRMKMHVNIVSTGLGRM